MVDDLRAAKSSASSAGAVADLQEKMNDRLDQMADNVLNNDRAYLPAKLEGIPVSRLPLDTDPSFHAMEVERAQLKLGDAVKNGSKIKELESELCQRAKELAKELKAEDLHGLTQAPRGIPLEILNLHKDAKCASMLEEKSKLVKSRSVDADPVVQSLNSMAEQMADGLLKGDREYLDREPEGVPIAELAVDDDKVFHDMEVERAVLKATNPVKNATTILELEDQLNARAHELAQQALEKDRHYLDPNPEGVPLDVLPLDSDSKFHQMEVERARQKRKGNDARVKELEENLNKRSHELAKKQLEDDLVGLDKEPEGYPIALLNLHNDEEFKALIPKLREAKKQNDMSAVRSTQSKLNDRSHEVAKDKILNDRAELERRPDGVPLELLPLDTDSQFKALEKELRTQKSVPKNDNVVSETVNKLNKRALDLAKDLRLKNRAFLDPEPEGIPIDDVPLDADEPFKNLEVERLRLLAAPNKSSKKAELSDLEEKLNKRAREVAAATKTEDRGFLKDSSYGIPKELIALDTDKEFNRTEKDLRRTLKHPERNTTHSAEDLKDKLQQRADEIALQQLRGGRDKYLDVQPGGVDLVDLPLDTDEEFGKLELERALAVARQDPSSTINDLEKKLNERAHALAVKVVDDDREFLPREIKNIAIEELPLSTDDKFKKLERQRRQHKRACKMDAVLEDEELLRQRANELAEDVIDQDLAPLKQCYRGIPTKELNLHVDEKFRDLANKRRRKRGQGRVKAVDMVAIEDEMDKRACEIADDLINEERGFLDQEPEGMHIMDVPLDDDPTFVQLEAEYRRRSKDPRVANMNKEVLRELCTELNQRSHALARNEFVKRREFMEPEPEGVPLYELGLDEDPEFKEAEIALYKNSKNSTPSPHVATEMQDRMSKRAQELARQILASDRDFLDPEPEGVQLSELPLDSDQTFGDLARERRRKKKNLQRGTGEAQVSAIEEKMNERSHELARTFLNAERAFLEPEPEGVPLADLPLNSDAGFRALEKERLKMKRDPSSGPSAIGGIEATLNDRCKQVARNLLNKERAFLDKEPMGVPLEDLPLNHDDRLNPVERRRRQLRKDPKRNQEEIRKCEDQMADRVNEIATEFIEKERAFMDQEPEGVPLRYLPLGTDKEFRELERQRRDQLQQPTPNQKTITQLEARMNERGHLLAKDLVEKGRSFLDPEPLGVPIADVPLNGDEQFRKMEEQRRSLKQDPRNAATVKALEERLNDRAYELAQQLLDKERAFMDQNPLDIPLSDLPLNQDLRMREIERTRRLLSKDNASGKHDSDIAVLGEGMAARSVELAKRTFEEERLFLNPEPCGVPLSDLPLFEDPEFHSKELERLKLRKKKQSSEKIRTLEADLNNRAKELAEEFIRKERAYLDQNPEGIPLERLPLDKDPVFHDMELERRAAVRSGADPNRVASLEDRLNQRVHELAMEIRGWQDKEFFDANSHVAPKWPRIGELFPEGRYDPVIPDEVSAGDVLSAPGDVGYLSPFIAALSRHPVLLKRLLVTEGHPVNAPYTFLFFDPNSNPVYVDVDDRVPCNANMEPMFVQSVNRYWYPLLLEKAYAKFVGGYEKLDNCTPHETLRDLTGRPVTHAPFDAKLAEAANIGDASTVGFWRGIADDISRGDIVLCMSNGEGNMDGIHPQCSYALIGLVETVSGSNNPADMVVKLHNPYNHYSPFYNGPLELNDPNWTEDLRRACRYDANRDDILYLPLPVFLRDFSSIQRCHINCGDRLTAAGAWDNNTAGGNPKFTSFRNNPIYLVENKGSRPTTILTEVRHSGPLFTDPDGLNHYPQTGIALMQPIMTSTPPTPLITNSTHRFLQKGMMLDSREVCSIMELPPNSTCYLIPYTMKANQMGSFNISVYPGMAKVTLTPLHFAGLSREPATTKVKAVPGEDGVRVDFMLSDPTTVHIILHQDKVTDQKTVRKGDAIAEDDVIFTVFDEQGIRCATTSEATNAREHSLAFKASQAGRYSLLVTVPNTPQTGDAPCTLSIYTPKRVTVKFVAPPAGARPLQQTRLPTLNRAATTAAKTTRPTGRSRRASSANDRNAEALPPISGRGGKKRSVSQGVSKKKNTESARF
ncbi:Calpain family cysteine protease/Calpain large subunit, domain III, putative [Angomonas deanei]|uniref:Calpain family cysteine protease/Calpain large subunit, domain III, putative n=1 Tax=Angomonas deanei TaxID=59799 RepID=A0A7G2CBX7_9TRYP|nr:Calpain family cysteine protease/Calpain large subunit, domain III, putative [Angomonas deanei]